MSASIKELKEQLDALLVERKNVLASIDNDVIYRRCLESAAARKKLVTDEKRPIINRIDAKIKQTNRRLSERSMRSFIQMPPEIMEFQKRLRSGTDWSDAGRFWSLRWVSKDQRFFILTKPSGKVWAGIGAPPRPVPATHYLFDLTVDAHLSGIALEKTRLFKHRGGPLTTKLKTAMIELALKAKNT